MIKPFLHTRLRPSPLGPHSLPRPHLSARLDLALTHRLTLLSAPPGFGKTTLLAEWTQFLTGHFEAARRRLTQAEAAPDFDSPQRGAAASLRLAITAKRQT